MTNHFLTRRTFVRASVSTAVLGACGLAHAQPKRETAKIIVGFTAGGMPDVIARRVAVELQGRYARSGVVDNKTGAGGQIAVSEVARAPNDGSVLLFTASPMLTMYPHTYKQLAYDPFADVVPVCLSGTAVCALAVGPLVPANVTNIPQLIDWVKANPKHASYASGAPGSPIHMLGVQLAQAAGLKMQHIAYRGTQAALVDIMAGQLPMSTSTQGEFFPHLKGGKIRVLAVVGAKRSPLLPDVATFAEQGFPQVDSEAGFMGFYMPKNTPAAVVQEAVPALRAAIQQPAVVKTMHDMGILEAFAPPEELGKMLRAEHEYWRNLITRTGFTVES